MSAASPTKTVASCSATHSPKRTNEDPYATPAPTFTPRTLTITQNNTMHLGSAPRTLSWPHFTAPSHLPCGPYASAPAAATPLDTHQATSPMDLDHYTHTEELPTIEKGCENHQHVPAPALEAAAVPWPVQTPAFIPHPPKPSPLAPSVRVANIKKHHLHEKENSHSRKSAQEYDTIEVLETCEGLEHPILAPTKPPPPLRGVLPRENINIRPLYGPPEGRTTPISSSGNVVPNVGVPATKVNIRLEDAHHLVQGGGLCSKKPPPTAPSSRPLPTNIGPPVPAPQYHPASVPVPTPKPKLSSKQRFGHMHLPSALLLEACAELGRRADTPLLRAAAAAQFVSLCLQSTPGGAASWVDLCSWGSLYGFSDVDIGNGVEWVGTQGVILGK